MGQKFVLGCEATGLQFPHGGNENSNTHHAHVTVVRTLQGDPFKIIYGFMR